MPTSVRVGLGSVNIGTGLLQGEVAISERVETLRLGTGIALEEQDELVTSRRASLSFATSDLAAGVALVNGPQMPAAISFGFGGSGPSFGASISGVLTSAEYTFGPGIAVCRLTYEAINGEVTASGGGGGGSAESVAAGLGTLTAGGNLVQSVSISASAEFQEQMGGVPSTLKERLVKRVSVRVSATFADFSSVTVGGAPADVTFVHNSGVTFTVLNAVLKSAGTRFSDGMAVLSCEWDGTGLTVS